jgi:hypothetical protein
MEDVNVNPTDDATLLTKIKEAVAAANEAEKTVTTAQAELVSRSKAVGLLLLEAKKLHPTKKDFEAFLERVDGLKLSRAYDLLRLAGGRVTDEQLKKETRDRVKKHRAKKLPKPAPALKKAQPEPEPKSESVTSDDVTDSAEANTEKHKPEKPDADEKAESARCLAEFTFACRTWLPKITVKADRLKAGLLMSELLAELASEPKAEAA